MPFTVHTLFTFWDDSRCSGSYRYKGFFTAFMTMSKSRSQQKLLPSKKEIGEPGYLQFSFWVSIPNENCLFCLVTHYTKKTSVLGDPRYIFKRLVLTISGILGGLFGMEYYGKRPLQVSCTHCTATKARCLWFGLLF